MQKKGPKGPKADSVLPVHSVSFSGFVEGNGPTQASPGTNFKRSGKPVREVGQGHSPCTLTTAYERKDEIKRLVISVQFNDANHWARKIGLRRIDEKIKLTRAQGGCPGTIRRRRTRSAAKSCGEPQAGIDPQISEWGNPAGVMSRHP